MKHRFDIALSFAGEDRDYVNKVANILKGSGIKVFYDEFEQANLWGTNLYTYLKEIYSEQAKYTIMFISKYYVQKSWTNLEREAAQERAFNERKEYILPARFDDTKIPGLSSTVSYIDLNTLRPYEFCKIIGQKLHIQIINETETNKVLNLSVDVSRDEFSIKNRDKINEIKSQLAELAEKDITYIFIFGTQAEDGLFRFDDLITQASLEIDSDIKELKEIIGMVNYIRMSIKKIIIPNKFILWLTENKKLTEKDIESLLNYFDNLSDKIEIRKTHVLTKISTFERLTDHLNDSLSKLQIYIFALDEFFESCHSLSDPRFLNILTNRKKQLMNTLTHYKNETNILQAIQSKYINSTSSCFNITHELLLLRTKLRNLPRIKNQPDARKLALDFDFKLSNILNEINSDLKQFSNFIV